MKATQFKMTELGPIPSDWEVKRLGEIANIQLGKMIDEEKNVGVEKSYLSNRDVHWGQIDVSQLHKVKMTDADLVKYDLKDGDLLVCEGGEVGRAAIWHAPIQDCYFQKTLHRVRLDEEVGLLTAFLLAILHRYADVGFFDAYVAKTSIAHLPKDKFELLPIPLPPLPEQRRIAAALSDVDDLIGALGKLVEKKRAIKTGAMQRLLTGQTRLPGFGGAEFKQTELGPIPTDWEVKRLGEIGEFSTSTVPASSIDATWYVGTETMLANMKGIVPNEASVPYQSVREYREGDILISNIRPYLKKIWLADRNGGCSTDVLVIRVVDGNSCIPAFLKMLLSNDAFFDFAMANAIGTKMPRGDKKVLVNYELSLPPLPEQRAIAAVLSDMDGEIAALEAEKRKVEAIKQGMMQELLTGKTRIKQGELQ